MYDWLDDRSLLYVDVTGNPPRLKEMKFDRDGAQRSSSNGIPVTERMAEGLTISPDGKKVLWQEAEGLIRSSVRWTMLNLDKRTSSTGASHPMLNLCCPSWHADSRHWSGLRSWNASITVSTLDSKDNNYHGEAFVEGVDSLFYEPPDILANPFMDRVRQPKTRMSLVQFFDLRIKKSGCTIVMGDPLQPNAVQVLACSIKNASYASTSTKALGPPNARIVSVAISRNGLRLALLTSRRDTEQGEVWTARTTGRQTAFERLLTLPKENFYGDARGMKWLPGDHAVSFATGDRLTIIEGL
jgi:hypothetical protein